MKIAKAFLMVCLMTVVTSSMWAQNGQRPRNQSRNACTTCPLSQPLLSAQPLSAEEEAFILYIREEEKLALEIYQALYSIWEVPIFRNIAASEQRHFDAMGTLITRYGLKDPAQSAAGIFTNPDLQKLYSSLLAQGSASLPAALQVGVIIEETDIHDLKAAIAITDNKDVLTVYGNLLNGSLKHLSAFNSHIETLSAN